MRWTSSITSPGAPPPRVVPDPRRGRARARHRAPPPLDVWSTSCRTCASRATWRRCSPGCANGSARCPLRRPTRRKAVATLCYLAILTSAMDAAGLAAFAERLRLTQHDTRFLRQVAALRDRLPELGSTAMLPSHIYRLLKPYGRGSGSSSRCSPTSGPARAPDLYERELIAVRPRVDGHYLSPSACRRGRSTARSSRACATRSWTVRCSRRRRSARWPGRSRRATPGW